MKLKMIFACLVRCQLLFFNRSLRTSAEPSFPSLLELRKARARSCVAESSHQHHPRACTSLPNFQCHERNLNRRNLNRLLLTSHFYVARHQFNEAVYITTFFLLVTSRSLVSSLPEASSRVIKRQEGVVHTSFTIKA